MLRLKSKRLGLSWRRTSKLVLAILFGCLCLQSFSQISSISGRLSIFKPLGSSSPRKLVGFADIYDVADPANRTLSNTDGRFKLQFVGVKPNTLRVLVVSKQGLSVVNQSALNVHTDQPEVLEIFLCEPQNIAQNRKYFYHIGKTAADSFLNRKLASLLKEKANIAVTNQIQSDRLKKITDSIKQLSASLLRTEELANSLADRYSLIDISDASAETDAAFSMFQKGNLDSAITLLNNANFSNLIKQDRQEIAKTEALKRETISRDSLARDRHIKIVTGLQLQADLTMLKSEYAETSKVYEELLAYDSTSPETIYAYSYFLSIIGERKKSVANYLRLLKLENDRQPAINDKYRISDIFNNLGVLYRELMDFNKSEKAYDTALSILSDDDFATRDVRTLKRIAVISTNQAVLFTRTRNLNLGELHSQKALEILNKISTFNFVNQDSTLLAQILLNTGAVYATAGKLDYAKAKFEESLKILKSFGRRTEEKTQSLYASCTTNLGTLYQDLKKLDSSEFFLKLALVEKRTLSARNFAKYGADLANALNGMGNLFETTTKLDSAEFMFVEAMALLKRLCKDSPEVFDEDIAMVANNLGNLYLRKQMFLSSYIYLNESNKIYLKLNSAFRRYGFEVASSTSALGKALLGSGQKYSAKIVLETAAMRFLYLDFKQKDRYLDEIYANLSLIH
jgi:tetratricopeptide (TPR) repeat protein